MYDVINEKNSLFCYQMFVFNILLQKKKRYKQTSILTTKTPIREIHTKKWWVVHIQKRVMIRFIIIFIKKSVNLFWRINFWRPQKYFQSHVSQKKICFFKKKISQHPIEYLIFNIQLSIIIQCFYFCETAKSFFVK